MEMNEDDIAEKNYRSTLPGVVILMIAIGLHFLSDGIREVLDPRSRK